MHSRSICLLCFYVCIICHEKEKQTSTHLIDYFVDVMIQMHLKEEFDNNLCVYLLVDFHVQEYFIKISY